MDPIFDAYLERLHTLHADIFAAIEGLPESALDWTPAAAVNSIAVLISHTAGSERYWIAEKAGNRPVERNRASEFRVKGATAAELCAQLESSEALAAEVLAAMQPADLLRHIGQSENGRALDAAWALWHALEHAAMHAGHIQITRQWWDQTQGQ